MSGILLNDSCNYMSCILLFQKMRSYVWHTSVLRDVKLCLAYFCFKRLEVMSGILLFQKMRSYVWHTSVSKDEKLCLAYFCFKR